MVCRLSGAKLLSKPMLAYFDWALGKTSMVNWIRKRSFKKMNSNMSFSKWRPICLGHNVFSVPSHRWIEDFVARSRYPGQRKVITSHCKLCDVITYPCLRYLLLATKSQYKRYLGGGLISHKTSYRKIPQSLEGARSGTRVVWLLLNLADVSVALLPCVCQISKRYKHLTLDLAPARFCEIV